MQLQKITMAKLEPPCLQLKQSIAKMLKKKQTDFLEPAIVFKKDLERQINKQKAGISGPVKIEPYYLFETNPFLKIPYLKKLSTETYPIKEICIKLLGKKSELRFDPIARQDLKRQKL
jgi:hypothetical protein